MCVCGGGSEGVYWLFLWNIFDLEKDHKSHSSLKQNRELEGKK